LWAKKEPELPPTQRMMALKELSSLQPGNIIEIGSHTMTIHFLSQFNPKHSKNKFKKIKLN
jgi:hypothetical protein